MRWCGKKILLSFTSFTINSILFLNRMSFSLRKLLGQWLNIFGNDKNETIWGKDWKSPTKTPVLGQSAVIIYRFSQAEKRSFQGISWCSFPKKSPETFRFQIYFGAFLTHSRSRKKSPKVFRIVSPIFWGAVLWIRARKSFWSIALLFFFWTSNWIHILLTSRLSWFLQYFHILSFNCQGLSNLLGLLAWMNLKRRSFTTTNDNLHWRKWVIFLGFHRVRILTNNTIATESLVQNLHWHLTSILLENLPERKVFGSFQAPVNYRRNIALV